MQLLETGLARVQLDEHGFLVDPDGWDEALARQMAKEEGIPELTEDHWKVLYYVRQHVAMFGSPPWVKDICRVTGMSAAGLAVLFPQRPVQTACRVAGVKWFPELGYLGCGADPA
ncbi:MAG: TusE/DsrC/DsvC family sulfur relay protein [Bacillota bacterium]|nr:TusE/DsrC/DsvC family sulfur relay protein [Bacillota bacterium]MDI7248602.1 TusE/DsrC/DsvC family sulfur relay protein [Bacillota bacterium]